MISSRGENSSILHTPRLPHPSTRTNALPKWVAPKVVECFRFRQEALLARNRDKKLQMREQIDAELAAMKYSLSLFSWFCVQPRTLLNHRHSSRPA